MADNYLERRMNDYREGRNTPSAQARRATITATTKSQPAIFIIGGETADGLKHITYFRNRDWRVAFTHPDTAEGRRLAQSSGAQHHPIDPSDLEQLQRSIDHIMKHWGHLDLILNFTSEYFEIDNATTTLLNIR